MNLFKSMRRAVLVASGAVCVSALAGEHDLTLPGTTTLPLNGAVGGQGVVSDFFTQPAGTGVFEPFLTIERNAAGQPPTSNSNIEQGYNTDGHSALYMDQQRPEWNNRLRVGDLAKLTVAGFQGQYYGFELDANEPGGTDKDPKNLISIDNIRIYTSATDRTGLVQNNIGDLDKLGDNHPTTLRWALNDPTKIGDAWNIENWIKLDSEQENAEAGSTKSNGGSGKSDMIVYIPVEAFGDALPTDYVWFYNLNGVHYNADGEVDGLAAQAGFEEWRAVQGPNHIPDGGMSLAMLGLGIAGLGAMRRKLS